LTEDQNEDTNLVDVVMDEEVVEDDVVVEDRVPVYVMSRSITTFKQVWKEYNTGLDNGPAVKDLEAIHKTKWRKDATERKFFQRRLVLYQGIKDVTIHSGKSVDVVIMALDAKMVWKKKKLNWFVLNKVEIENVFD